MNEKLSRRTTRQITWPQLVLVAVAFLWIDSHGRTDASAPLPGLRYASAEDTEANCDANSPEGTCANAESTDTKDDRPSGTPTNDEFVCGVYVAPSTLPGTGLGMYAGPKGFSKGELITKTLGDHVISIPDLATTHSDTGLYDKDSVDMTKYFLWDQYTWNAAALGIGFINVALHNKEIASPGFGAAANSFMDFVNVDEGYVDFGVVPPSDPNEPDYNIHRSKDPGAGAFTLSHSRKAWANQDIAPNSEFFVSYGDSWFLDRAWRLGTIPVTGDHEDAEWLWKIFSKEFLGQNVTFADADKELEGIEDIENYEEYSRQKRIFNRKSKRPEPVDEELAEVYRDFWDTIVASFAKETWTDSRTFASLPRDPKSYEYDEMLTTEGGYKAVKKKAMKRSQEWLDVHGICADSVRIGRSILPNNQAGHGAFANTHFKQGEAIMSAPLIHIADRAILDTYYKVEEIWNGLEDDDDEDLTDEDAEELGIDDFNKRVIHRYAPDIGYAKTGEQLMLNYVFGHRDSTMALSPYAGGVQLINHNQTLANVKMQWAVPRRSNHHPHLLKKSVAYINNKYPLGSVLGMEVVATRDIAPDEELYLDYGDEWEEAWQTHVREWEPLEGSEDYVSAVDLNTRPEHVSKPIPNTYGTNENSPFPKNVRLTMNAAWKDKQLRQKKGDDGITELMMWDDFDYLPVEFIVRTGSPQNRYKYIVEDESLFGTLTPDEQDRLKKKYKQAELESDVDYTKPEDGADDSLYTVVVKSPVHYSDEELYEAEEEGIELLDFEKVTVKDVPRRGLKFEDLSYTTDQFLENSFREYIRIPDEIFPEAWKNLETDQQKKDHYWKYRYNPDDDGPMWHEKPTSILKDTEDTGLPISPLKATDYSEEDDGY